MLHMIKEKSSCGRSILITDIIPKGIEFICTVFWESDGSNIHYIQRSKSVQINIPLCGKVVTVHFLTGQEIVPGSCSLIS